jgi:cephalosporin-C deacetylase-like acetyl esterase
MKKIAPILILLVAIACQIQGTLPGMAPSGFSGRSAPGPVLTTIQVAGTDEVFEVPAYTAEDLLPLFTYDPNDPLEVEAVLYQEQPGHIVYDVSYTSSIDGRVTAYLVVPAGDGPYPAILYQHWGGGNRSQFLDEAITMAEKGMVSLLVDAPFARPAQWKRTPTIFSSDLSKLDPQFDQTIYVQTVDDLRRGVDLLVARPEVDPARIAFVGHSYGATFGGVLAGLEPRIRAYVLMSGLPGYSILWGTADTPGAVAFREAFSEDEQAIYHSITGPLDPIHYIGQAQPSALFFQYGLNDPAVPTYLAQLYFDAASEPKRIEWYEAGHTLDVPEAQSDRIEWLTEQLFGG